MASGKRNMSVVPRNPFEFTVFPTISGAVCKFLSVLSSTLFAFKLPIKLAFPYWVGLLELAGGFSPEPSP